MSKELYRSLCSRSAVSRIYFSPFWQETVRMCHSVGLQFAGLPLWRWTVTLGQSYSLSCAHRERCARGSAINNIHASPQTLGWFMQSRAGSNISSTFWSNWIVPCTKFIEKCKTFTCSCGMEVKKRHINVRRGENFVWFLFLNDFRVYGIYNGKLKLGIWTFNVNFNVIFPPCTVR